MKKFLCVCEGGNVRSHALAFLLHDRHGCEAVAVGWRRVSAPTLDHFCHWADYVVVMQEEFRRQIAPWHAAKVRVVDVGPDRFGLYIHPELVSFLEGVTADWQDKDFEL